MGQKKNPLQVVSKCSGSSKRREGPFPITPILSNRSPIARQTIPSSQKKHKPGIANKRPLCTLLSLVSVLFVVHRGRNRE